MNIIIEMKVFIHTRDLRIPDNRGLTLACGYNEPVCSIFILDPVQMDPQQNRYFSPKSFAFMIDSLIDLRSEYHKYGSELLIFYGSRNYILGEIGKYITVSNFISNSDVTPFAKRRDMSTLNLITTWDFSLHDLNEIHPKGKNTGYLIFTPFYNNMVQRRVTVISPNVNLLIKSNQIPNYLLSSSITNDQLKSLVKERSPLTPGRTGGIIVLNYFLQYIAQGYSSNKDIAAIPTSHLSAHIKFGTLSIREIYVTISQYYTVNCDYCRQLIWHDFYLSLMYYLPENQTVGGGNYRQIHIEWNQSNEMFQRWTQGLTGYPIIDAGMRELKQTGWMHNRCRLLTSNFLVFGLGIDWKWGELWYAQNLVDYDVSSNNGNWQWSAGVGIDRPRVWPRTYNLSKQSIETDPNCVYIKKYIPELSNCTPQEIHNWTTELANRYNNVYPAPIVDYDQNKIILTNIFKTRSIV